MNSNYKYFKEVWAFYHDKHKSPLQKDALSKVK